MAELSPAEKLKALLEAAKASQANSSQVPAQDMLSPSNPTSQPNVMPVSQDPAAPTSYPQPQAAPPSSGGGGFRMPVQAPIDPHIKQIQDLLRSKIGESEEQQKGNIELNRMALAGQFGKKQGLDLSNAFATARMLGAKDAGEGYVPPADVTKGDEAAIHGLTKAQQSLTDDQVNQLKAELNNRLAMGSMQSARANAMLDRTLSTYNLKMSQELDPSHAPPGSAFGRAAKTEQAASKLQVLAEQVPDLNFSNNQMVELATSSAALLSGGSQVAQSQIEHLLPKTVDRTEAGIFDWFTSDPHGSGQEEFARQMLETADREQALAQDQIYAAQQKRLSGFEHFKKMAPGEYEAVKGTYVREPERKVSATISAIKSGKDPTIARVNAGANTANAAQYDGSTKPPANATPEMKTKRLQFLQSKAGH